MRLLKIENNIGYFYSTEINDFLEIDKIDRDSVLFIIDYIMKNNDIVVDEYKKDIILNKAQDIVYQSLYIKLKELIDEKENIINEINEKYKEAFSKYQ